MNDFARQAGVDKGLFGVGKASPPPRRKAGLDSLTWGIEIPRGTSDVCPISPNTLLAKSYHVR
jgi:hypothetical protein